MLNIFSEIPFFDSLNNGVAILDDDLNIHYWNSWLEANTGKKRDELLGKNITTIFPEIKKETLKRKVKNSILLKSPSFYSSTNDEYLFKVPINKFIFSIFEYMQQNVIISPYDIKNSLVSLTIYDETQLIENRILLQKLNEDLENRVQEEITKNREKDRILEVQSRQAAMGEMISAIAHQWRQPLSAISLKVQEIEDITQNQEIKQLVDESLNVIDFMSTTIDDFRNFFKPNKKKKEFYVLDMINSVLDLITPQLKLNNINFKIISCCTISETISIYGYESELKQVILNLLNNSRDALIINNIDKNKEITIYLDLCENKNKISILVEDNAGGIKDTIIDKVFLPYFTTKDEKNGTGIGLYMSKNIIENSMYGEISVKNGVNGAIFKVVLPIIKNQEQ